MNDYDDEQSEEDVEEEEENSDMTEQQQEIAIALSSALNEALLLQQYNTTENSPIKLIPPITLNALELPLADKEERTTTELLEDPSYIVESWNGWLNSIESFREPSVHDLDAEIKDIQDELLSLAKLVQLKKTAIKNNEDTNNSVTSPASTLGSPIGTNSEDSECESDKDSNKKIESKIIIGIAIDDSDDDSSDSEFEVSNITITHKVPTPTITNIKCLSPSPVFSKPKRKNSKFYQNSHKKRKSNLSSYHSESSESEDDSDRGVNIIPLKPKIRPVLKKGRGAPLFKQTQVLKIEAEELDCDEDVDIGDANDCVPN